MEPEPTAEAPSPPPKRRGRPPKSEAAPKAEVPAVLGDELVVRQVPLSDIDLDDTTYRFRAVVRVADLVRSIRESGQQIPAVVRPHPARRLRLPPLKNAVKPVFARSESSWNVWTTSS